jgi:hypothetical protein
MKRHHIFGLFVTVVVLTMIYGCDKDHDEGILPKLTTSPITEITSSSALSGGTVTATGSATITSYGICWSTQSTPTIADERQIMQGSTSAFTADLLGLQPATQYYVRSYATTPEGTAYGNILSFTTQQAPPVPTITFQSQPLWIHPTDNGTNKQWADDSFIITDATSLNDGKANTSKIVATLGVGDYAAKICDDLTAFGYSDWYLPSREELEAMENQKSLIGNFDSGKGYWTSTEFADFYAYVVYFNNGMYINESKTNEHNVRCVRKP